MARSSWLHDLEEWKECRSTIARLDGILADLRKYSFSLVTVLITATGFFITKADQISLPAVSIGIMVLITALFAVDRYYTLLLNGAVERALNLEGPDLEEDLERDSLTQILSVYAVDSLSVFVAPALYLGLMAATLILASGTGNTDVWVERAFWTCSILTLSYFGYTETKRGTGRFRQGRLKPKSRKD
jgi:hypothetical protein